MIANLKKNKKKGFTLVELIVVIAIIAIIAAVAVPTTISYVNKAKVSTADQEATELMNTLTTAMTDLALNSTSTGVSDTEFAALLNSVMPDVQNVTTVKIDVTTLTAVKVSVLTDVAADDSGKYEDETLEGKVGAVKTFNWTEMGISAGGNLGGSYTYSSDSWAKAGTV